MNVQTPQVEGFYDPATSTLSYLLLDRASGAAAAAPRSHRMSCWSVGVRPF